MSRGSASRRSAARPLAVVALLMLASAADRIAPADDGRSLEITIEADETWWAGVISESHRMPFDRSSAPFEIDLLGNTAGNQVQPLLLSTKGRYVWSEEPFRLVVRDGRIRLVSDLGPMQSGRDGSTLREAALHAARSFFPASGRTPDPTLFTQPQFNTWIELTYDQNQRDVLAYARAIVANGFPPAVLMIDEGWAEGYGVWDFHRGRFPDPKGMMDELHRMGFKVMLWVCPYIQPDGKHFAALSHDHSRTVWLRSAKSPKEAALVRWWDGFSAVADLTNPQGREWFTAQLKRLVDEYGVDGFKLDGGDAELYDQRAMVAGSVAHDAKATPNRHTELFARIGLEFPLNEYRACWKMGGQPLAQRLRDKEHNWADLRKLVPGILNQGLMGYPFSCPDMIGGGEYQSFRNLTAVDQELIVRGAEVHALMPMMQFSVSPWRVLSPDNLAICRRMAALHTEHGALILALARESAKTGQPIVRSLEYAYPNRGYAGIVDQFLLGADLLVAPVIEQGARQRRVVVPPGQWNGDDGGVVTGPKTIDVAAPLDRLPRFRRVGSGVRTQ
jgi:alpha-glucosidase (family GH31 glycosyl hydrolase)